MYATITREEMAEGTSDCQTPPWIQLPSDVWLNIGNQLGTRNLARASTVIKVLGGVQPQALNLAHNLSQKNKVWELIWGCKRTSRVLGAEISLRSLGKIIFKLDPEVLIRDWSFPSIQELCLDMRIRDVHDPLQLSFTNSFGGILLTGMKTQLQVLKVKAHVLEPLPFMPQLRHLTIKIDWLIPFKGPFRKEIVESIAGLPVLQTLHAELVMPVARSCQPVMPSSHPFKPLRLDLDLRTCVSLQAVCLVGMIPKDLLLPPAAKLTLDVPVSNTRAGCNGLRLSGPDQIGYRMHKVDFRMLSALSLQEVKTSNSISDMVHIYLGDSANQLRFLSVTCSSKALYLSLSLPKLTTLIVHATHRLEFEDPKIDAAKFDTVSIAWKVSDSMKNFEGALRARCQKQIFAGVLGDTNPPHLAPHSFVSTRQLAISGGSRELFPIHPCTVASGACGACLEHCCPLKYPVPEP